MVRNKFNKRRTVRWERRKGAKEIREEILAWGAADWDALPETTLGLCNQCHAADLLEHGYCRNPACSAIAAHLDGIISDWSP